ncbi:hypothetical protein FRC03_006869 [Tulasnella sp. 419]|nr:hypothetical protein FRC03_006869 [Tulasnella sp. 419]
MHWDSVETAIRTSFDEEPLTFLKSTLCRQTNQAKSFEFGPTRQEATFTAFFQFGLRPSCLPFLAMATFVTFIVLAVNYSFQSRSSLPSRNNQHQTPHILLVPSLVLHPPLIGANIAGQ